MTHNLYYKLDENKNVVPSTMEEANELLMNDKSIVKQEKINNHFISTVFLAIDHDYLFTGKPVVFETMIKYIIEDVWLDYQERYSTWQEAEEGHKRAVQWVKDICNKDKK